MNDPAMYELLSAAYRKHLQISGTVLFSLVIEERIEQLKQGAPGKDSSELEIAVNTARSNGYDCMFLRYCETLLHHERARLSIQVLS